MNSIPSLYQPELTHGYWVYLQETLEAWMPTRVYMDVFTTFSGRYAW